MKNLFNFDRTLNETGGNQTSQASVNTIHKKSLETGNIFSSRETMLDFLVDFLQKEHCVIGFKNFWRYIFPKEDSLKNLKQKAPFPIYGHLKDKIGQLDEMWLSFQKEEPVLGFCFWRYDKYKKIQTSFRVPSEYIEDKTLIEICKYLLVHENVNESSLFESPPSQLGQTSLQDISDISTDDSLFDDVEVHFQDKIVSDLFKMCFEGEPLTRKQAKEMKKIPHIFSDSDIEHFDELSLFKNLKEIGPYRFQGCSKLRTVSFPNSIIHIDSHAFDGCELLEKIDLPEGLKWINLGTFNMCKSLKNVTLPSTIEMLNAYAFGECEMLEFVIFPQSNQSISVGTDCFYGCKNLKRVENLPIRYKNHLDLLRLDRPDIEITYWDHKSSTSLSESNPNQIADKNILDIKQNAMLNSREMKIKFLEDILDPTHQNDFKSLFVHRSPDNSYAAYCFSQTCGISQKIKMPRTQNSNIFIDVLSTLASIIFYKYSNGDTELRFQFARNGRCSPIVPTDWITDETLDEICKYFMEKETALFEHSPHQLNQTDVEDIYNKSHFDALFSSYKNKIASILSKRELDDDYLTYQSRCVYHGIFGFYSGTIYHDDDFYSFFHKDGKKYVPIGIETFPKLGDEMYVIMAEALEIDEEVYHDYIETIPDELPDLEYYEGKVVISNDDKAMPLKQWFDEDRESFMTYCDILEEINRTVESNFDVLFSDAKRNVLLESSPSQLGQTTVQDLESKSQSKSLEDVPMIFKDDEVYDLFKQRNGGKPLTNGQAKTMTGLPNIFQRTSINTFDELKMFTSLTSIEEFAFWGCRRLESINIPNNVKKIGRFAFEECSDLKSINIPNSITKIRECAFKGCRGLENITVSNNNTVYDSRDNCNAIIKTATNTLLCGCINTTIPNSVTSIEDYAFADCTGLTRINIPNSVTKIGIFAFYGCSDLKSINIPNSVVEIGKRAFYGCGLEKIILPEKFKRKDIFKLGINISKTEVIFSDNYINESRLIESSPSQLGQTTVQDLKSKSLENVPMPFEDDLVYDLFKQWNDDKPLTIKQAKEMTKLPDIFKETNIKSFDELKMFTSLTSFEEYAFSGCKRLESIIIPNSIRTIKTGAFWDCGALDSINIPNGVYWIGTCAFAHNNLKSITVSKNNTTFDSRDNCNAIIKTATNTLLFGCANTVIPNSVTAIDDWAFNGCLGLKSISVPNSVTKVGWKVFSYCINLEKIIIPKKFSKILHHKLSIDTSKTKVIFSDNYVNDGINENEQIPSQPQEKKTDTKEDKLERLKQYDEYWNFEKNYHYNSNIDRAITQINDNYGFDHKAQVKLMRDIIGQICGNAAKYFGLSWDMVGDDKYLFGFYETSGSKNHMQILIPYDFKFSNLKQKLMDWFLKKKEEPKPDMSNPQTKPKKPSIKIVESVPNQVQKIDQEILKTNSDVLRNFQDKIGKLIMCCLMFGEQFDNVYVLPNIVCGEPSHNLEKEYPDENWGERYVWSEDELVPILFQIDEDDFYWSDVKFDKENNILSVHAEGIGIYKDIFLGPNGYMDEWYTIDEISDDENGEEYINTICSHALENLHTKYSI